MKKLLLLLILVGATVSAQWTKDKGEGYYKLGYWTLNASGIYEADGSVIPVVDTTIKTNITSLYFDQGIGNGVSIKGYIPYFSSFNVNNREFAVEGIGDIDVELEVRISKKYPLALSLKLGIPTGNDGVENNGFSTGDGEFNQVISLKYGFGYKLLNQNFYGKAAIGYNNRTNGFSDDGMLSLETGTWVIKDKFLLLGRYRQLESTFNGDVNSNAGNLFANNAEYKAYGFEAIYKINKHWGISYNHTSAFDGRNIWASPSNSGGISYQF